MRPSHLCSWGGEVRRCGGGRAQPEEITALATVVARRGGIYATHMRSEGGTLLEAIDEALDVARATGVRLQISHLKTAGRANWHKLDAALEKILPSQAPRIGEALLLAGPG